MKKTLIFIILLCLQGCSLITPLTKEDNDRFNRDRQREKQRQEEPEYSKP